MRTAPSAAESWSIEPTDVAVRRAVHIDRERRARSFVVRQERASVDAVRTARVVAGIRATALSGAGRQCVPRRHGRQRRSGRPERHRRRVGRRRAHRARGGTPLRTRRWDPRLHSPPLPEHLGAWREREVQGDGVKRHCNPLFPPWRSRCGAPVTVTVSPRFADDSGSVYLPRHRSAPRLRMPRPPP